MTSEQLEQKRYEDAKLRERLDSATDRADALGGVTTTEVRRSRWSIVSEARFIYAARYGHRIPEQRGCLFWAAAFNEAAREAGLDALIQAGSASFQYQTDDGKRNTHFSYVFESSPAMKRLSEGKMPEMHVWSWLKDTNEIVDLSTGYQPSQMAEMLEGEVWEPRLWPPRELWVGVEWLRQCNHRFIYSVDPLATMMALRQLEHFREGGAPWRGNR